MKPSSLGKSFKVANYFLFALIFTGFFSGRCFGFDDEGFQYWSTASTSFDIDKDWRFTFNEEFRLGDDGGNLYYHHSDLGFVYGGLADWMDLGLNYMQAWEKDGTDQWRSENRPHLNLTLKGELFDIGLSNRSRLEYRDRENKKDVWRYRNKVTAELPLEVTVPLTELKLHPYLADEVFINFDGQGYNKNRVYSGVSFKLWKNSKGSIYYLWQSSRKSGGWEDINVIGTQLKFYF